jgi:hypothetical protein
LPDIGRPIWPSKGVEFGGGRLGCCHPVDRLQIGHDQLAVLLRHEGQRVGIRWIMQVCTVVSGKTEPIASGKPPAFARACFEPVDDGNQDVVDAAGVELGHHLQPELGTLGLPDPQPEHLLLAFAVEGEGDIDALLRTKPSSRILTRSASKKMTG